MAKKSKTVQQVEVGDGLALGVLASGIAAITSNKMTVELGFRFTWRRWGSAGLYPQVNAGPSRDDIYHQIIGRSAGRRTGSTYWRHEGRLLVPCLVVEDSTAEEELAAHAEFSEVPAAGSRDLAEEFLGRLRDDEKYVSQPGLGLD